MPAGGKTAGRPTLGRWTGRALKGSALLLVLGFLVTSIRSNYNQLADYPLRWNFTSLASVLAAITLVFYLQSVLWNLILRRLGLTLPFHRTAYTYFLSLFGKYIPGKVWVPAFKIFHLNGQTQDRESGSVVIVSVLLEQVFHIASGLLFGCLVIDFEKTFGVPDLPISIAAVFLSVVVIIMPAWTVGLVSRFRKNEVTERQIQVTLSLKSSAILYLSYLSLWVLFGAAVSLCAGSLFGLPPGIHLEIGAAYALGVIIGFAALFAPGGIGVRESVFIILTKPVFPASVGILFGFALRLVLSGAELTGLGAAYVFNRILKSGVKG